jgi:hypothetical protein
MNVCKIYKLIIHIASDFYNFQQTKHKLWREVEGVGVKNGLPIAEKAFFFPQKFSFFFQSNSSRILQNFRKERILEFVFQDFMNF